MSTTPSGITAGSAAIAASLSVAVSLGGLYLLRSSGREYPALPWFGVVPMALYVILVLFAAVKIQQYVRGAAVRRPDAFVPTPQQARGTLVAAQAGAIGGAMLVGFYAACALVHLGTLDVASVRELFIRALVSTLAAAAVSAAGFVAQWMCRLPEDDGEDSGLGRPPDDEAYG